MRTRLALALLLPALLLAACASRTPAPSAAPAPEDPAVAECREEARRSPELREFGREQNFNNPTQMEIIRQRRLEAEGRAFNDCLRRRGLSQGGGVERIRPAPFF